MIGNQFWTKYFRHYDVLLRVLPYARLHTALGQAISLAPGARILDAGAGTGNSSVILRDHDWRWISLDLNREGLRRMRAKVAVPRPIVADLRYSLPFPDSCFDAVLSSNVLYDLPAGDRLPVLREFYRVLKPDGRVVVHNLLKGFRAVAVYRDHLVSVTRERGLPGVLEATRFIWPTVQILRMNRTLARGEEATFFELGEQAKLLEEAGFSAVSRERRAYAHQGSFCSAVRPGDRP